jgi:hypothetical protein
MATKKGAVELQPSTEIYKSTRGQIEYFENAINVRVIWLSIGQSFFFGVYATLVSIKAPTPDLLTKQHILTTLLPIAAVLTALFTLFDVVANLRYMHVLRIGYEDATKDVKSDKVYPFIWGEASDRVFQHTSPILIPVIFIVSWIIILLFTYNLV